MSSNPLDFLKAADPSLFEQTENDRQLAFKDGEISKKHQLLIALAIDAAKQLEHGTRALAQMALDSGATKNEIMETLRIVHYLCGVGSTYTAAGALKDMF